MYDSLIRNKHFPIIPGGRVHPAAANATAGWPADSRCPTVGAMNGRMEKEGVVPILSQSKQAHPKRSPPATNIQSTGHLPPPNSISHPPISSSNPNGRMAGRLLHSQLYSTTHFLL